MSLGPVEYALFAFAGDRLTGEIVPALAELVQAETVRIIDLAFLKKEPDGTVRTLELDDLPAETIAAFDGLEFEIDDLLNSDDLLAEAEILPPGTAAALIVWENLWATRLATAVRAAGGTLVDRGPVDHEIAEIALAAHLAAAE